MEQVNKHCYFSVLSLHFLVSLTKISLDKTTERTEDKKNVCLLYQHYKRPLRINIQTGDKLKEKSE